MIKRRVQLYLIAVTITFVYVGFFPVSGSQVKTVDFNRDIRPILSNNCFACHGPDDKQRMANLRLDTKEGAFGKPGVIVPSDSARSKLIMRVTSKDPNVVMPPPESGHKLTGTQIELLKRWIDEGAPWTQHWAYLAPTRSEPPKVNKPSWVRNPIDNFILARLEKDGLTPSPEADKVTLLRRLHFDLTGLPPTPAEIDAFLADKSPDAYEKVVERLFASPHYGERMAMQWLDLARYADTHGYHIDSHRDMWPWRDWVIKAFNQNMPFDRFTIEQLAGDLLPNATEDQKIASGFNRNHMINFEGGAIPDEYLNEYIVDRVETTATTWMGMTMGCARCHSHKYDPISHKEFYQFYAFFNNVPEEGIDGTRGNAKPFLTLPTAEQTAKKNELSKAIEERAKALSDEKVTPLQAEWEGTYTGKIALAKRDSLAALYELDGSLSDASGQYRNGRTIKGDPTFGSGQVTRAVYLDGQTQLGFGKNLSFDSSAPFTFAVWMRPNLGKINKFIFQMIDDEQTRRGYEMLFEGMRLIDIQRWGAPLTFRLTGNWPESSIRIRTRELFNTGEWKHLAIIYDGSGKASGFKLYLNGQPAEIEVVQNNLKSAFKVEGELQIGSKATGSAYSGALDDLRIYTSTLKPEEIKELAVNYPILVILSGVSGKRTKEEIDRLREYYLTYIAPDEMKKQHLELKSLRIEKAKLEKGVLNVMLMGERKEPRETFILARGDYRNKTEKVTPGVPEVLPPINPHVREKTEVKRALDRLDLAEWLVDSSHPLTARVAVNRYWQMFLGVGMVKTSEDFGIQGERPIHPELLDWLATEFIKSGWNIRHVQRLIVTSATYRQSSKVPRSLSEKDPENRLLARGPRFRLPAEMVRDNALAVSGLLKERIGGPSVFPYQPAGLWEELAFGDGFSAQAYVQSHGEDLYRRSMYTFWKRTVPPASLVTFDAPDREKCVARRPLTNTPLQALVLLNDPTYLEAARALAQRVIRDAGKDVNSRLIYAFRLATARRPVKGELTVLRSLLNQQLLNYRSDNEAAGQLLSAGESETDAKVNQQELAAWTMVMSAILNLDETITKE
jgi:Protein of unknown function (DUF1553)/Protein of unknown function (DUF1549)/Concanavalin A-like lectin/glucanases superfamily/Planctomycete cytochrome C